VLIALGRSPGKTDDIDYLVTYGYRDDRTTPIGEQTGGKARIVIPGQGTITLSETNQIDAAGCSAACYLFKEPGGVCTYTSTSEGNSAFIVFKTNSPNSNVLTYYMPSDKSPKELNEDNGVWKDSGGDELFDIWKIPTAFNYELQITIPYYDKSTMQKSKKVVYITSRKDTPRVVDITYKYILPLKIAYGCILEGTLVLTEEGLRPIETIHIGDRVYSPETGDYAEVVNTWSGFERSDLTELSVNGASVTVTGDHPVFTPGGYVAAKCLKTGDIVLSGQGMLVSVTVKTIPGNNADIAKVYNLDTESNRGFAVGSGTGIWVGTNMMQNEIIANGGK
jgi:hypothetical protein